VRSRPHPHRPLFPRATLRSCSTPVLLSAPLPFMNNCSRVFTTAHRPWRRLRNTSPSNKTERGGARVEDVTIPTLTPHLVEGATHAVVICPGGAYEFLSWELEGTAVAAWLNSLNVSAFILKYRVPARPWLPFGGAPLMDAQRAMGLLRSNASQFGLNSSTMKLGIIGFSAGSHLSAHLATTAGNDPTRRAYPAIDAADRLSCRPDFVMLLYPWCVVGDNAVPHASCNAGSNSTMTLPVTRSAPSFFITQAEDDPVHCENALLLYLALKKAGAPPSELHLYSAGGHGFGLCQHGLDVCSWTKRAQQYLETIRVLPGDPRLDPDQPPGPNEALTGTVRTM
jgi:acetyl esterase/lipase